MPASRESANETNTGRLLHGGSSGCPGQYVEKLGDWLLWESPNEHDDFETRIIALAKEQGVRGVYRKHLSRHVRGKNVEALSPTLIFGEAAPDRFVVRENGLNFELSFCEGYSYGLFLDQRDNRRRLLKHRVAPGFELFETDGAQPTLLNTFAYTCGFSVSAAVAGVSTTSLDLSRKYLDWGRRNFELNDLSLESHDFIYGDAFDWFRRLAKKRRSFDAIILDPPTFSKSKGKGIFRAESDYGRLVESALPLLKSGGVMLSSTNAARLGRREFLDSITAAVAATGRSILRQRVTDQPGDFPESAGEPAYLKTVWMRIK
jgi:23S rRNA (cytosine1962-C5)-methyltransferase